MIRGTPPELPSNVRTGRFDSGAWWGIAPGCNGPETTFIWRGGIWFPASEEGPGSVIKVLRAWVTEERAAVAAEREACAKIADANDSDPPSRIAAEIRARGAPRLVRDPGVSPYESAQRDLGCRMPVEQSHASTADERGWRICDTPVCGFRLGGARVCALPPGHDDGIHDRK